MLDIIIAITIVVVSVIIFHYALNVKIFTSIVAGLTLAWIIAGISMQIQGQYESFNSQELAERRMVYSVLSVLALLGLVVHLTMTVYKESSRKTK